MTTGRFARSHAAGPRLAWGVANRALRLEDDSGDQHVVQSFADGALLAALDGLGHGAEAAMAARLAAGVLEKHAGDTVIQLVRRCHEALTGTRGVVMSLASFRHSDSSLTWLGVGNVQGLLLRANHAESPPQESLLLRGGVVGYQLPPLYAAVIPVLPGDLLVFATDGIRSDFAEQLFVGETPQALADRLLANLRRETDDALVLAVQFPGGPA